MSFSFTASPAFCLASVLLKHHMALLTTCVAGNLLTSSYCLPWILVWLIHTLWLICNYQPTLLLLFQYLASSTLCASGSTLFNHYILQHCFQTHSLSSTSSPYLMAISPNVSPSFLAVLNRVSLQMLYHFRIAVLLIRSILCCICLLGFPDN